MHNLTIKKIQLSLRDKTISPQELVQYYFERMKKFESKINTSITILNHDEIKAQLKPFDKNKALASIPYVMKDAFVTKNIRTTAGSMLLDTYIPQYSATVKNNLDEQQAILLAKNSQDCWGHGATSENTDYSPVKNPWDLSRSAGGSSGGTAAAIAAGFAPFGIGEDTGGSIRNPASYCNLTGLKVTYGRVSRYGAIAYASSLDTVGPIARNAEDLEIVFNVIKGKDKYDATTWEKESKTKFKKRIGVVESFLEEGINSQVKSKVIKAIKQLEALGYEIEMVKLPNLKYVVPVAYIIAWSETSSNLARYDGIRFGKSRKNFTDETMRRIMIGTFSLSAGYFDAYYKKAQRLRTVIRQDFENALKNKDAIIAPTSPILPPLLGDDQTNPLKDILADWYTYAVNLAGLPSISLPVGFSKENLPIGMQLIGRAMEEETLLKIAQQYQQHTDWHNNFPKTFI